MRGKTRLVPDPQDATRFIRAAWGDPLPHDVLIWTMETQAGQRESKKLSYWLKNYQGLEQIVRAYAHQRNIYAGVGLPGPDTPRTSHNRCESTEQQLGGCFQAGFVSSGNKSAGARRVTISDRGDSSRIDRLYSGKSCSPNYFV